MAPKGGPKWTLFGSYLTDPKIGLSKYALILCLTDIPGFHGIREMAQNL